MYGEDRYPITLVNSYEMTMNHKDARFRPDLHHKVVKERFSNKEKNSFAAFVTTRRGEKRFEITK
jgi:hypothetical protein